VTEQGSYAGFWGFNWDAPADDIFHKPWRRWPYRASYRGQIRDARRRRNIAKRRGAR
jgi:hypothetical protein